jgi:hypothetical protein
MANDQVPRSYYLHPGTEAVDGGDETPPNPGAALKEPVVPVSVTGISSVRDFDSLTMSGERGTRQVMEVTWAVLREVSAADLLRKCDDAALAGVELQIKVVEDRGRM